MVKRKLDGAVDESSVDRKIRKSDTIVHNPRGPTLGEIPYALAEINFEITKSEAC